MNYHPFRFFIVSHSQRKSVTSKSGGGTINNVFILPRRVLVVVTVSRGLLAVREVHRHDRKQSVFERYPWLTRPLRVLSALRIVRNVRVFGAVSVASLRWL